MSRMRARLHAIYEILKNADLFTEIHPTREEIDAFKKANPEQGEKLNRIESQNTIASKLASFGFLQFLSLVSCKCRSNEMISDIHLSPLICL